MIAQLSFSLETAVEIFFFHPVSMKDLVDVYVSILIINSRNEFIFFTIVGYLEDTPEILDSEEGKKTSLHDI